MFLNIFVQTKTKINDMAAHLFRRYVWLLDLVSRTGGIKLKDICSKWENSPLNDRRGEPLPKRTLHNHIAAIEEIFDIRIVCQRQGDYRYVVEGKDGKTLSSAQEAMIQHLRISNALIANPRISQRIILDKSLMYKHLNPLLTAIDDSQRLKIYYWRVGDKQEQKTEFSFEPYFIKQFAKEWFVVGRVVEDNTMRILKFDSIRKMELLEETFDYPDDFNINHYLDSLTAKVDPDSWEIAGDTDIDDSHEFALLRYSDTLYRRSTYGSFIPDEAMGNN